MQQSEIAIDTTICHFKTQPPQVVAGIGYFPDRSDQEQLVREALEYYRLMVFFKNYPLTNPADSAMIYVWIVTSYYLQTIQKEENEDAARKKLMEIARETVARPGDKNFFMGSLIKELKGSDWDTISSYFKNLKEILVTQLLAILFTNGKRNFDFKFWVGMSKRKFMGLSYTGI